MLVFGRLVSLSRTFGTACFRQQYCHASPLSSVFLTRCLATDATNKDLPKIKKAKGPYLQFADEKRVEVMNSNPGIKLTEVARIVGSMWKGLSEEEKKVYQEKFELEKKKLHQEQEAILDGLTSEQKQQMLEEKRERRRRRKDKKLRALRKSHNRPRPVGTNPFLLYVKSQMLDRGEANLKMYLKGASDFWKKMPEEDKQPFIDEAKANSQKYRDALAKWEGRMLVEGHEDLISRTKLNFLKKVKRSTVRKPAVKRLKPSHKHKKPVDTRTIGTQTPEDKKTPKDTTIEKKTK